MFVEKQQEPTARRTQNMAGAVADVSSVQGSIFGSHATFSPLRCD